MHKLFNSHSLACKHFGLYTRPISGTDQHTKFDLYETLYDEIDALNDPPFKFPIESLLLFNPAMHAGELSYPIYGITMSSTDQLKLIPRKAIIYSKTDFPNGFMFGARDLIMSGQISQAFQSSVNATFSTSATEELPWPVKLPFYALTGGASLVSNVLYGVSLYSASFVLNTPFDFGYHIMNHQVIGNSVALDPKTIKCGNPLPLLTNTVDYFIPVIPSAVPKGSAETWAWYREENDWGFFS